MGTDTVDSERIWRILIVDDHPLVRTGLVSMIQEEPDLEVCGQTGLISEAMELVREAAPDLVTVDLSLADGNGLELIKRLQLHHGAVRVLVCSMHDEALFAQRALRIGARGYIGKAEATTRVVEAIRHVLAGHIWLSEEITGRVLESISGTQAKASTATVDRLSNRELEVFELIGRGLGPSKIADRLHLSIKTVETHRENIKKKLNLHSGSELTRRAIQWSLEQS